MGTNSMRWWLKRGYSIYLFRKPGDKTAKRQFIGVADRFMNEAIIFTGKKTITRSLTSVQIVGKFTNIKPK